VDRRMRVALAAMICLGLVAAAGPSRAAATGAPRAAPIAYLDGHPIQLSDVGKHHCEDFAYPVIHCFSTQAALDAATTASLSAASVNYVAVYEYTNFQGASMYFSQDYSSLVVIGWNDRISSLRSMNNMASTFYTDWFYTGQYYLVCCNQQLTGLGVYDNTFSSVTQP
jgi:Beta/Gamma crystallin